ncbi:hypothetical protein PRNP1_006638 [Phytophthora ramorum]
MTAMTLALITSSRWTSSSSKDGEIDVMLNLFQYLEMAENPGVLSNQMLVLMVVEDGVKYKNHLCKYGKLYLTEKRAHGKPLHCRTARKRPSSCTRRTATRCGSRHCIYHRRVLFFK